MTPNISMNSFKAFTTLLIVSCVVGLSGNLRAQAFCDGPSCDSLPFSRSELTFFSYNFQDQYVDGFVDEMTQAQLVSHLSGIPQTPLMDGGVTAGLSAPVGLYPTHFVTVASPGIGVLTPILSSGVGVTPRVWLGIRPSELFKSRGPDDPSIPGRWDPDRFEFFVTFFQYRHDSGPSYELDFGKAYTANPQQIITSEGLPSPDPLAALSVGARTIAEFDNSGAEVRYRLFDTRELGGWAAEWDGLSVGLGFYSTELSIKGTNGESKQESTLDNGQKMKWFTFDYLNYKSKIQSALVEAHTGIRLLYLFDFTLGAGVAYNQGGSSLEYVLAGPVTVNSTDVLSLLGATTKSIDEYAFMGMRVTSEARVPQYLAYYKPGLELRLGAFRIMFQGTIPAGQTTPQGTPFRAEAFTIAFRLDI